MAQTQYAVIPAPGYYGDTTRVISAHRTQAAAERAARPTSAMRYVVIRTTAGKGDIVYADTVSRSPNL